MILSCFSYLPYLITAARAEVILALTESVINADIPFFLAVVTGFISPLLHVRPLLQVLVAFVSHCLVDNQTADAS